MYSSKLKINLLAISVLAALFPTLTLAANLTVEQRLQLLEAELSANKKELQET
ncbi:carbohydrate porin, partial [Salmonella enterica]|nr:carbohydrate porin [Salmonella enterica]